MYHATIIAKLEKKIRQNQKPQERNSCSLRINGERLAWNPPQISGGNF